MGHFYDLCPAWLKDFMMTQQTTGKINKISAPSERSLNNLHLKTLG